VFAAFAYVRFTIFAVPVAQQPAAVYASIGWRPRRSAAAPASGDGRRHH
jgi:hypothetical protein